jgi:S1-C subfamily serine protease
MIRHACMSLAFFCVFACLACPQSKHQQPPQPAIEDVTSPCVSVVVDDRLQGAGVTILWGGRVCVLTAGHVVNGGQKFGVRRAGGRTVECELIKQGNPVDLALLCPLDNLDCPAALLCSVEALKPGESLWTIGAPGGLEGSLHPATVDVPCVRYRGRHYLRYAGDGWYGNSGGGVYVLRGGKWMLCGITVMLADPRNPRTPCYAERHTAIQAFLRGIE